MPSQCLGVLQFTSVSHLTYTVLGSMFSFLLLFSSQVSPCVLCVLFLSPKNIFTKRCNLSRTTAKMLWHELMPVEGNDAKYKYISKEGFCYV